MHAQPCASSQVSHTHACLQAHQEHPPSQGWRQAQWQAQLQAAQAAQEALQPCQEPLQVSACPLTTATDKVCCTTCQRPSRLCPAAAEGNIASRNSRRTPGASPWGTTRSSRRPRRTASITSRHGPGCSSRVTWRPGRPPAVPGVTPGQRPSVKLGPAHTSSLQPGAGCVQAVSLHLHLPLLQLWHAGQPQHQNISRSCHAAHACPDSSRVSDTDGRVQVHQEHPRWQAWQVLCQAQLQAAQAAQEALQQCREPPQVSACPVCCTTCKKPSHLCP